MVKINELKQRVLDARAALNNHFEAQSAAKGRVATLLEAQLRDGTSATEEAKKAVSALQLEAKAIDEKISATRSLIQTYDEQVLAEEQRLAEEDAALTARPSGRVSAGPPNVQKDPRKGFADPREFLSAVLANSGIRDTAQIRDERLRLLAQSDRDDRQAAGEVAYMLPVAFTPRQFLATVGSDEHGEYSDTYGGFSMVTSRIAPRPLVGFEGDPTAGRTEAVPMSTPSVEMEAATDKDHTSSVSAGLTVTRKPETVAASASRMAREMITFKASGLFGLAYATEELLADSPASFMARINSGFAMQFAAAIFNEKLRGKGGNEYLGVLTALAASSLGPTISIAKESAQAAATILYNNVIKMRARCWGYGQAIWIANHDCYPQLAVLAVPVGVGGQLIYQQSAVEDRPDMLLGRPIFYSEHAATLGTQGDLILGNWSQFGEGLYQPLQSAESMHVRFVNHERAMKFWLRNAGAPFWRVPLTPNKSSSTLSPFVVLDTRA